jgi:2'-5' RNA ligase
MTSAKGCSIWLMPTGHVCEELSKTIFRLSNQYATPRFPPHVTLIAGLTGDDKELLTQTSLLASRIRPLEIVLTTMHYLDEYFKCLFFRVEETPALLEANRTARTIFHRERDPGFMPHLSMVYGSFDLETKRQMVQIIGTGFNGTFRAGSVHLYSTHGEPEDWRRVQEFEIPG